MLYIHTQGLHERAEKTQKGPVEGKEIRADFEMSLNLEGASSNR